MLVTMEIVNKVVKILLEKSTKIDEKNKEYEKIAIMYAVLYGHSEVVFLLIINGADIDK
jgi:ankyrin repeat protein